MTDEATNLSGHLEAIKRRQSEEAIKRQSRCHEEAIKRPSSGTHHEIGQLSEEHREEGEREAQHA